MGTWSHKILGNDASCDVRDSFLESYYNGEDPKEIAVKVIRTEREILELERTYFWLGLALVCWECRVLTEEIFDEVKRIIESGEDLEFCREMGSSPIFLKKREKELNSFLKKISNERKRAISKRKPLEKVEWGYTSGMCLSYKNPSDLFIGIFITESKCFKQEGDLEFMLMDFESEKLPDLDMFKKSKLFGVRKLGDDWNCPQDYKGTVTGLYYSNEEDGIKFKSFLDHHFVMIGKLPAPDQNKLSNDTKGGFSDFEDSRQLLLSIEETRKTICKELKLSQLTLVELIELVK